MQGNKLEVFLKKYREEIHRSAAEMLPLAMPDVTEELFDEFERTGERLGYERVYFTRRKYLAILGMETILRVKERDGFRKNYREELGAEADGVCDGKAVAEVDGAYNRKARAEADGLCDEKAEAETDEAWYIRVGEKTEPDFCVSHEATVKKRSFEDALRKLCGAIESICSEETWALPAHVNRKAENWQETVDLFASETAQTLANLMDELWEVLPEATVLRMQAEIRRRVLNPFFESEVPYSWWEGSEMNWNAVCAGAIGSVCIHFHNRSLALPMEFSACISRICSSLTHYIDGFSDDGACMEGLGYYTYGMAFYVNFMRELEDAFLVSDKWNSDSFELIADRLALDSQKPAENSLTFDSQKNIVDSLTSNSLKSVALKSNVSPIAVEMFLGDKKSFKKLRRIAEFPGKCFFTDGRSVSFSDGDSRDTWRVGIWCAFNAWFDDLPLPNLKSAAGVHADSCYRFVNLKMDIFETEKYLERMLNQASAANKFRMGDRNKRAGIADTCYVESARHEKAAESSNRTEVSCRKLRKTDRSGISETDGDKNNKMIESNTRADIFSDAQWCIAESTNGIGFACKGGHNDEPHNHNDIGHFIYEAGGTMFLTDLGAGEYTADYFGAKRYQFLCNSSAGHSVPVLNGENQRCGREYRCGEFAAYADERTENTIERRDASSCRVYLGCKGENGNENSSPHVSSLSENKTGGEDIASNKREKDDGQVLLVRMDIGSAWPQEKGTPAPCASVQRTFHFDLQTGRLEIEDTFDRTQWESVTETLITQIPPEVEENKIYLRGDSGIVVIYIQSAGDEQDESEHLNRDVISGKEKSQNMEMEGETPKIRVRKLIHRNHVGEAEKVYGICWDVSGSHIHFCVQHSFG